MRRWVRIPICAGTEQPLLGMWKRNPAAKAGPLPGRGLQKAAVTMADTHRCQDKDFQDLSPHPPAYLKRRNVSLWNVLESVISRPQKIWRKNIWRAQRCYLGNKTQPSSFKTAEAACEPTRSAGDVMDVCGPTHSYHWWQTPSKLKGENAEWNFKSTLNLLKFKVIYGPVHRVPAVIIESHIF